MHPGENFCCDVSALTYDVVMVYSSHLTSLQRQLMLHCSPSQQNDWHEHLQCVVLFYIACSQALSNLCLEIA